MTKLGVGFTLLGAVLVAACQPEAEAPPPAQRLPAAVCEKAREGLERLSKAGGAFRYDAQGEATIEQANWLALDQYQREGLGQALAIHAACGAEEPPREQTITIRSEYGTVLTQRVVETSVDVSQILKE
jgi:hypothetical protein